MTKKQIRLSNEFRSQTTIAIISIIFFIMSYLLILVLAIALTILCVYLGIALILAIPRFLTIVLGVGLGSIGILVLIFLVKFVFKSHKVDRSHLLEIKKDDEPELFGLIDDIVKEVKTSFPKKVYLAADVNAAVFYDSSFWSMFFPVKKNLQVGLGLVNTVSREELKAILSHEFGHFSQRTMKVGSYVYNVNQVIFNLIYDNDSYDRLIQSWANISGYFSIFVVLAVKIVQGIQWILTKLYDLVNKSYMGLSREMEFHADEIAAIVTGFEPLKSALLRMSLADHSFNGVLSFYEGKIGDNIKSRNVYREQLFVMDFLAKDRGIPILQNLPQVTLEELNKFNKSKLVIKDQWASHPSTEERIARLEEGGRPQTQKDVSPANDIFRNLRKMQKKLTDQLFSAVDYEKVPTSIHLDIFQREYQKEFSDNTFSPVFNGYYDHKNPSRFDMNDLHLVNTVVKPEDLFSHEQVDLVYEAVALENDLALLEQIADKTVPVKTFDYDGKKYKRKESARLKTQLASQLERANEQIKQNDIRIFKFLSERERETKNTSSLENMYREFFEFDKMFDSKYQIYSGLSTALQFVNFTTHYEQIRANFTKIVPMEASLKGEIRTFLASERYQSEITKEMRENFEMYLSKDWKYFGGEKYNEGNLEILFGALNDYVFLLSKGYFLRKKKLLDYQEELLSK